jgi:hypothetical protein
MDIPDFDPALLMNWEHDDDSAHMAGAATPAPPAIAARRHPLAMTSRASCPPYATTGAAARPIAREDGGGASAPGAVPAPPAAGSPPPAAYPLLTPAHPRSPHPSPRSYLASHAGPAAVPAAAAAVPGPSPDGADAAATARNAAWSTHLSALTSNFLACGAAARPGGATGLHSHVPAPRHFGTAVNGFHPQVNARRNPVPPLPSRGGRGAAVAAATTVHGNILPGAPMRPRRPAPRPPPPRPVVDSRGVHGAAPSVVSGRSGPAPGSATRERNTREQARAKKISELIDELRNAMQQGGWQEEVKSKYQTLDQ